MKIYLWLLGLFGWCECEHHWEMHGQDEYTPCFACSCMRFKKMK